MIHWVRENSEVEWTVWTGQAVECSSVLGHSKENFNRTENLFAKSD